MTSLVQSLPPGPLDIVGDVHGDLLALENLLRHLGYDPQGRHSEDRRLVFVGDLVDRGPDSPGVVALVRELIQNERAQCVLGNHELNLLLGREKADNGWFFGRPCKAEGNSRPNEQQVLDRDDARNELLAFFQQRPLALFRDDVRVVHAFWQPEMVSMASEAADVVEFYQQHRYNIDLGLAIRSDLLPWQRDQRHQNLNPVKVLTSGLEMKAKPTSAAGGKSRQLERFQWWFEYQDEAYCFFGHYCQPYETPRSPTRAFCLDYGISRRWLPKDPADVSPRKWRLAAARYPELQVVFDNGDTEPLSGPQSSKGTAQ